MKREMWVLDEGMCDVGCRLGDGEGRRGVVQVGRRLVLFSSCLFFSFVVSGIGDAGTGYQVFSFGTRRFYWAVVSGVRPGGAWSKPGKGEFVSFSFILFFPLCGTDNNLLMFMDRMQCSIQFSKSKECQRPNRGRKEEEQRERLYKRIYTYRGGWLAHACIHFTTTLSSFRTLPLSFFCLLPSSSKGFLFSPLGGWGWYFSCGSLVSSPAPLLSPPFPWTSGSLG